MADMADLCSPHPHAERLLGCSVRFMLNNRPRCYIYIAADSYLKKYKEYGITAEAVRRHELKEERLPTLHLVNKRQLFASRAASFRSSACTHA